MLSDKQVKSLKAQGRDKMLADGGGLYVRVSRHGSKTFVYRTREGGKARYVTLGEYPLITLAEARAKAADFQGHVVTALTVGYAIDEYLKHIANEYEHPEQVKQRLYKDIVPVLGNTRLSVVTAGDISNALQKIVDRGAPVAANRTLADVRHVFDFAFQKGWIKSDPSQRITRKVVGGRERARPVVVTDDEIKSLITVMRKDRFEVRTRIAVLVILLTGQRSSEVLGITREEVNGAWWTIPAERTKAKREQKVYLTYLVRWLLSFAHYSLGGDHRTISRAFKRMKLRYIPRDLRRTMATRLSESSVAPHVVEKLLNHRMEGVMAVYNHAEYLPERKEAWNVWTKHAIELARD